MKKKLLAGILSLAMVFSMMPATLVSAEETDNTTQTETQTEKEQEKEPETEAAPEETQVQTSDSEAIEALQSRINSLPTVDEFIALADGTSVEDSTLNQAQLDVYNEAQAIAEEIDKLTDEEQGQLDTEKLDALFEYFNGMTEETALSPGSTVTLTSSRQYITQAGTYNINTSTVSSSTANSVLTIQSTSASDNIVINIKGNITIKGSKAIIYITSPCNLTINGNSYTIKNSGSSNVVYNEGTANVTFKGGTYEASTDDGAPVIANKGTMNIYDATFKVSGTTDSGQVFSNSNGTINIYSGTIDNGPMSKYSCIVGGTVNMYGGTVTAQAKGSAAINATTVNFTGGTIQNSKYGIAMGSSSSSIKIGGNATFTNNTADIYLASGKQFTIVDDFAGTASVGVADTINDNTKRQITTTGTDQSMLAKVTSVNPAYAVNYDTSGKYLYLWQHKHTWDYSASGNTITAKCTSDSNCDYYSEGLTATLTAPDMIYTGSAYDKAEIENNITSVTSATASTKYAGRGETTYTESTTAPANAGIYTAKVTIGGATATADFTITKATAFATVTAADDLVYNGSAQQLLKTADTADGTLWYKVGTDGTWSTTKPTAVDAGTYTIYYYVQADENHENLGSKEHPQSVSVTVQGKEMTVSATGFEGNYDGKPHNITVEVTDPAAAAEITYEIAGSAGLYTEQNPAYTEVGEYTVNYKVTAKNYKTVTGSETVKIRGLDFTSSDIAAKGYSGVYDGKAHTITVEVTKTAAAAKVTYCTTENGIYSAKAPEYTNAAIAQTVYYKVEQTGYNTVKGSETVTISRKSATVTLKDSTMCFGNQIPELKYEVTGLVEGEKLAGLNISCPEIKAAGTYTISATDSVDTNYDLTILPATLTAGEHQWSAWTEKKAATATKEGKKVRTCEKCGRIQVETIPATGDTDNGNLDKNVEIAENAPIQVATLDNSKTQLQNDESIYGAEEQAAVADGKSVKVWVDIKEADPDVLADYGTQIEDKAKEALGNTAKVECFDAELFKQIEGSTATKISQTNQPIRITIEVPENLLNHNASMIRNYEIIRLHNGTLDVIQGTFDETTHEFTFETSQFSTYAIAYADKPKNSGSGSSSSGNSGNTTPAKPTVKITTTTSEGGKITASKTGDITKGDTVTYTITPADGYEIKDVLVDGKSVGAVTSYTFTNVTEKHTISAVFAKKNAQEPQKPDDTSKDDNKNNVTDQSKLNGNQVSKLKLPLLLAKGKGGKKQITLSWLKVKDADGYEAYWSYCDGGKNYKKFATVKNGKLIVSQKKLKNSEQYKYFVVAYKMVDGKKVYIAKSNYLHVAMLDNKQTNAKSVSVNKTDVVLNKNKTFTIKAQTKLENSKKKPLLHTAEYRYYTTDARVAKVNSDGVITAKGAGSCTIYVLANNGVYKKIKVTVK